MSVAERIIADALVAHHLDHFTGDRLHPLVRLLALTSQTYGRNEYTRRGHDVALTDGHRSALRRYHLTTPFQWADGCTNSEGQEVEKEEDQANSQERGKSPVGYTPGPWMSPPSRSARC